VHASKIKRLQRNQFVFDRIVELALYPGAVMVSVLHVAPPYLAALLY
jgi:hypothetical protein